MRDGLVTWLVLLALGAAPALATDWGVKLGLEKAVYQVGETLQVNLTYYNLSAQTVVGLCPVSGGLGCCYDLVIEDEDHHIVTQPDPMACLMAVSYLRLGPYQVQNLHEQVPLVAGSFPSGGLGPLPPGFYRLCFRDRHVWPVVKRGLGGTSFEVCVPFRID